MSYMKTNLEQWFFSWGALVFRFKITCLAVSAALFLGLVCHLPDFRVDTSSEGFLHAQDPVLKDYRAFKDQFGREELIVVAVRTDEIFNLEFLKALNQLHLRLENEVPHLAELTSLINARRVYGAKDSLVVEGLFERWPASEQALAEIKHVVMNTPHYQSFLVDEDLQFTTLVLRLHYLDVLAFEGVNIGEKTDVNGIIEGAAKGTEPNAGDRLVPRPLTDEQISRAVAQVRSIVDDFKAQGHEVYIAGSPVVFDGVKRAMQSNMKAFVAFALVIMVLVLWLVFRRLSGVFLPLTVVAFSVLSTVSLMTVLGDAIKIPTQILPSFILVVGVGGSIHVLSYFFRCFNETGDKQEALSDSLSQVGMPLLMTSLTTALGMLSFAFADIAPVADLGIYSSIGIGFALLYTLLLLPALLAILPLQQRHNSEIEKPRWLDQFLSSVGRFSVGHPGVILFTALLLVAISFNGLSLIHLSHNPLGWLPERSEVRLSTNVIDQRLRGSTALEVVVDTGEEYGVVEPKFLAQIESIGAEVMLWRDEEISVGSVRSVVDFVKEINQALNESKPDQYRIPDNRQLIAQELFVFEFSGSNDLERVTDQELQKARVSIKLPWVDVLQYGNLLARVENQFNNGFPASYEITLTGITVLLGRTLEGVIQSTLVSYLVAGSVISLLMIFLIGNLKIGLISMVPNFFPIVCVLGLMGYLGLPLDLFTMLIGSIAVGLAVDDTIHFMHRFQREYRTCNQFELAVESTLQSTGRAMLSTSVVLSLGFFVFCFSEMGNLYAFGLLTGVAILLALLSDFLIAPALLKLVHKF